MGCVFIGAVRWDINATWSLGTWIFLWEANFLSLQGKWETGQTVQTDLFVWIRSLLVMTDAHPAGEESSLF